MTSARLIPDGNGTYTLVVKALSLEAPIPDETPISDGQRRALHAKANDLDRLTGQARSSAKRQAKEAASEHLGRELESTNDLSSSEASWLLDWLEERIEAAKAES